MYIIKINEFHGKFQNFLLRVASHPVLSFDKHFISFLQQREGWRESIKETGIAKKNPNSIFF